ncbi:unnamed protein product, partial [Heterosigma akashiwo]
GPHPPPPHPAGPLLAHLAPGPAPEAALKINRDDQLDTLFGPFPCVKVRGLPFEASYQDLVLFFQGLMLMDIVFTKRADGRETGEAYVLFTNHLDTALALQRDKGTMGHRYLEIFQARRGEYYHGGDHHQA